MPTTWPGGVHQRAAAAARVDRRVGLDVDHRVVGFELAADGAHHAHRHGVVETERAAEGEHQLPGAQRVGIAQRQARCSRVASTLSSARSVSSSTPATVASRVRPRGRTIDWPSGRARPAPPVPGGRPAPRGSWSSRSRSHRGSPPSPTTGAARPARPVRRLGIDDQAGCDDLHRARADLGGQRFEGSTDIAERHQRRLTRRRGLGRAAHRRRSDAGRQRGHDQPRRL